VLPSGVRLVRLGPGDGAWLIEYEKILRVAAQDFLRRARLPGVPEGVLDGLWTALDDPQQAVWLVLDPAYRLLGFAWVKVTTPVLDRCRHGHARDEGGRQHTSERTTSLTGGGFIVVPPFAGRHGVRLSRG
jgi:hypothetical protein